MAWNPNPVVPQSQTIVLNPFQQTTITYSPTNTEQIVNYFIQKNELPSGISANVSASGITLSGIAEPTPWGYVEVTYQDNGEKLVSFKPNDLLKELPKGSFKHIISVKYDNTPSIDLDLIVGVHLQQTTATGTPIPNQFLDKTQTYTFRFLNDWSAVKSDIQTLISWETASK